MPGTEIASVDPCKHMDVITLGMQLIAVWDGTYPYVRTYTYVSYNYLVSVLTER